MKKKSTAKPYRHKLSTLGAAMLLPAVTVLPFVAPPLSAAEIEEIVVTVTKQNSGLQETPAAISAVGSDMLITRGITNLAAVQNLVPSIRLQRESVSTEIYIRGVGSTLDLPMIEPPNAYNINGVYIPREVSSATLFDVERVEVLPGPQGTLYGRGAIGGVINTVTKRPSDQFETEMTVEAGNYSKFRATVSQNLPINDNLRIRAAVSSLENDGHTRAGADSFDDLAGFIGIDFTLSDDLSVYVWTHVETKGGKASNLVSKGTDLADPKSQDFTTNDPWDDRLLGASAAFATLGPVEARDKDWDVFILGAELNWHINDNFNLTYIPSYLDFEWQQNYQLGHKLGDFGEDIEQNTHEIRLAYDGKGSLTWMTGLYYYKIENEGQLFLQLAANELFPGSGNGFWLNATDVRDHELSGIAAFGQATWVLTDSLRLVFGGRISKDEREGNGFQPDIVTGPTDRSTDPVSLFTGLAPATWQAEEDWTNVDWKIGIEMDVLEESLLYANIQTGFQPGTFDTVGDDLVTEESVLLAFTAGIKNRFLNGQLLLNNEFFYYQYDDLLTQAFDGASGVNRLTNADTTIWGDQLDIQLRADAMPNTRFKLSLGYLNARYKEFTETGLLTGLEVFEDNQLQNAPDFTATLGVIRDWDFKSGAFIRADISSRYESSYWGDFSHSPGIYQKSYHKTDTTLTYHSSKDNWTIGLWVKNMEDQDVQSAAAPGSAQFDPGPGLVFLEAPRTFGVRYTARLGE